MVGIKPKLKYKNTEALKKRQQSKLLTFIASFIVICLIFSSAYMLYQSYLNADKLIQQSSQTVQNSQTQQKELIIPTKKIDKEDITLIDNSLNKISIYLPIEDTALLELKQLSLKGTEDKVQNHKLIQFILIQLLKSQNLPVNQKLIQKSVRSIFYHEDSLIIDLSKDSLKLFNGEGLTPIILHYAFVNSVLENFPSNELKILFDGKTPKQSDSIIDYSSKFQMNQDLIKL
ncbi:hypothetical protein MJH12_18505 [bacterium]|nr:hypothetical protein [bacterium]